MEALNNINDLTDDILFAILPFQPAVALVCVRWSVHFAREANRGREVIICTELDETRICKIDGSCVDKDGVCPPIKTLTTGCNCDHVYIHMTIGDVDRTDITVTMKSYRLYPDDPEVLCEYNGDKYELGALDDCPIMLKNGGVIIPTYDDHTEQYSPLLLTEPESREFLLTIPVFGLEICGVRVVDLFCHPDTTPISTLREKYGMLWL